MLPSTGKFEFDSGSLLFCLEFIYFYTSYIKTLSMPRGKTTTRAALDSNRLLIHVPLRNNEEQNRHSESS